MTVEEIKKYLRVDDDFDDEIIEALQKAAIKYIQSKTGKTYKEDDEVWNLAIKLMIAHWYENREIQAVSSKSNLVTIDHTADSLMSHIALCGDYD